MTFSPPGGPIRFGVFELDPANGELRKSGSLVRLKPQPLRLLTVLAGQPGRTVTREEIQKELWPNGTFVDFEQGVNHCVREIRAALGDDADVPRYVETLPRRGYRFIAPVEPPRTPASPAADLGPAAAVGRARRSLPWVVAGLAVVLLITGVILGRRRLSVPAPTERVMLVVLPFENLSGDPAQEYLSDGFTEEMITQLGSLHPERLGVIARTSAMKYKGTREGVAEIGRQLGVDYLLEGSVRKSGERLRVSAQLIKVRDQTHLWADSYERELSDVLAVEGEVARAIAGHIQLELTQQQEARLAELRRVDRESLEHYLKGRYYWNQRAPEALRRAREHFEQALARDPAYAAAWAGLAECYVSFGVYEVLPVREAAPRAKEAARKALELDESLGPPHATLGAILGEYDWDFPAAEREFRRAIELAPSYATAHQWYAEFLLWSGRFDEAEREMGRAGELDPLSLVITRNQGLPYFFRRDYSRAREHFRRALELDPNFAGGHMLLGLAAELAGDPQAAAASLEKAVALDDSPLLLAHLARSRARAGRTAEARRMLAELLARSRRRYVPPFDLAIVYVSLGNKDRAFAYLEQAYQERSYQMVWLKVDPWCDYLRSDPRFVDLLRRVGVPETAS